MNRSVAAILLFFLAFLQGVASWDQFERHEVCAHGELVHAASETKGEAPVKGDAPHHDHCSVLGALGHAAPLARVPVLSEPVAHSQTFGVAAFAVTPFAIVLAAAPKTSPPLA